MTNQDLFTRIASNLQAYDQLQAAIAQDTTGYTGGLHWASGDLLAERRELMAWYAQADMVIFRCTDTGNKFWINDADLQPLGGWVICPLCDNPCDRLMIDGTWQTQVEKEMGL